MNSDPRKATEDLLHDIKSTFKKYTKGARQKSWEAVTSKGGEAIINKLIKDPGVPVVGVPRLLSFKEWLSQSV